MPSQDPDPRITAALRRVTATADASAAAELLPLVYEQLQAEARRLLARERPGQTLQATALVHEAWLRLADPSDPGWDGRRHFFAAATEAMRRILIDQARRKARSKHGGHLQRSDVEIVSAAPPEAAGDDLLAVDQALARLEAKSPRLREIVNMRYFSGFSAQETADALGISLRTVEREWRFVRAWLKDTLSS